MTFNEITNVREGVDKSGRNFKTITLQCTSFSQMTHPVTGATVNALGNSSTQTVNAWESGENSVDSPYNHLYNAGAGTAIVGSLVSREVETYQIEDNVAGNVLFRDVNTYSCFVPADQENANFESAVKNAFRWNGHPVTDEVSA